MVDDGWYENSPAPKPRGLWERFRDSYLESALHNPFGAEGVVRATTDLSTEELNKRERILSDRLQQKRDKDEEAFKDVDTLSPANIGKQTIDLLGNILGGVDPSYVFGPGKTVVQRIAAQAGINAGLNAASQDVEVKRGVRDEFDPTEVLLNAAAGGAFQGAGEVVARSRAGRRINRGAKHPEFGSLEQTVLGLEGGGTLSNPRVSPKGAKGPYQVMDATARDPGFGIRPWDGKSEADRARVGRQYLAVMTDRYDGDHAKILAAYNAGPGNVDKWVKKWGADWQSHIPFAETRKYVRNGLGKLGVGPQDLGDIRLVQNELPSAAEMARVNDSLAPKTDFEFTPEEQMILNQADDPVADFAPPIDSAYDRFTPYVDTASLRAANVNEPADEMTPFEGYRWYNEMILHPDNREALPEFLKKIFDKINGDPLELSNFGSINRREAMQLERWFAEHGNELPVRQDNIQPPKAPMTDEEFKKYQDDWERDHTGWGYDEEDLDDLDRLFDEPISPEERAADARETEFLNSKGHFALSDDDFMGVMDQKLELDQNYRPTKEELARMKKISERNPSLYWEGLGEEDVLTPAERQDMDASVPKPEHTPTTPKGLGKGSVATTPVNDLRADMFNQETRLNEKASAERRGVKYNEVWMSPDEYTKLALGVKNSVTPREEPVLKLQKRLAKEGLQTTPYLHYDKNGKLTSQEGLHRAAALKNLGYKKIPVNIYGEMPNRNAPPAAPMAPPRPDASPEEIAAWEAQLSPNRTGLFGGVDDTVENRLIADLKSLKPMTGEQRALYRKERSRRASSLSNLQKGQATRENVAQQFASQRGQLPRKAFQSIAENYNEADFISLANRINHSPRLLPFQKLNALKALNNLLGVEGAKLPTPSEIKLLSEVYSEDFIRALLDNRDFLSKVWQNTKSALNIPRAIMSSMDFSAPFRQGIGLVHKKEFWKSIPHMFKMWADTMKGGNADKQWLDSVKSHPRWQLAHDAKLAITDPHSHFLADREEDFMTDLAERIPGGLGRLIKASNSAYSGFLNKLRWDTFNNLIDQYEAMGEAIEPKQLKQVGKFVNMATGRGDLGKTGNAAAPALSAMLFSPRLIASRIKTLASPVTYMKADPLVRKEAWKSLLAMSGYYLTIAGLAKYGLGMDVETDPRSPDFMKAKVGNTRYDFMAGYSQYIRLGAQILTDSTITGKGEERALTSNEGYRAPTRRDVAIKFFLNKLAPVPGLVSDWMEGSDAVGNPFEWKQAISTRMLPMASQDIADALNEWGPKGALMGIPGLFGWSVQTYEPKPPKEKKSKSQSDWYASEPKKEKASTDDWYTS